MTDGSLRLKVWSSGAYAVSCVGPNGRGALVEHDGRDAVHVVGVTAEGFDETVVRRRTTARGVVFEVFAFQSAGEPGRLRIPLVRCLTSVFDRLTRFRSFATGFATPVGMADRAGD